VSEFGVERAWSYALALLTRRSHTEAEIRERLARKLAGSAVIDEVVERLARYRLVDDGAFAEAYVRSRSGRKGSIALRHELRRKGVPEEAADSSLAPLDEQTELANAVRLLARNAWRFRIEDARRGRARAFAFLARRGFPAEVSAAALEQQWLEQQWVEPADDG
jgi:regulatory protein